MKADDLIEALLYEPKSTLTVELHNGQRIPLADYQHELNMKGEPIIVLLAKTKPRWLQHVLPDKVT